MGSRPDYTDYVDYILWPLGYYTVYGAIFVAAARSIRDSMAEFAPFPMPYVCVGAVAILASELYVNFRFWELGCVACKPYSPAPRDTSPPLACSYVIAIASELWAFCVQLAYGWFVWPALGKDPSPSLLAWPLLVPHYILLAGWITSAVMHIYSFDLRRQGLGPIPARVFRRPRVRRWMRRTPIVVAYFFAVIAAAWAVARG